MARSGLGLAVLAAAVAGGAAAPAGGGNELDVVLQMARRAAAAGLAWYHATPPADRVTWGGLAACALLGALVLADRLIRVRARKIIPRDFVPRFLVRLQEGRLDRGKALDFCELNPSPAARVVLGAVRRWDRPVTDQERAVSLAVRVESDRLRRNLGTLRRVAGLAPLLGLLGSLVAAGRALSAGGADWGPALAAALSPLTVGVALAILALVAYDGLAGRHETIVGNLERLGAETIDAIAMSEPEPRAARTPHAPRIDRAEPHVRPADREADLV